VTNWCVEERFFLFSYIGRLPHLLELELLDTGFVWGDGRALDADSVLFNGLCSVDRD